jgi:ABC-2 type transport system ATP-binding protein
MSQDIAIKIENVSKTFYIPTERKETLKSYFLNPFHKPEKRKFDALKDISFEVKKGEFLGIIGRNGSGKSTLLKILAGIYLPDKGKVTVNGKIVPFLELGVGFNPELSGRENVFLNGTILGMSKKYLEKKFDEIVDFAEVREFIDMPLIYYSSGMQVRLAFAIATVIDGDIYLMDEVMAVGDTNFQSKCLEVFNKYKDMGKSIILVTHDVETVKRYCHKALLLREGFIQNWGNPSNVVSEYINENVSDEELRIKKEIAERGIQEQNM